MSVRRPFARAPRFTPARDGARDPRTCGAPTPTPKALGFAYPLFGYWRFFHGGRARAAPTVLAV
jgi:hypothetical protein